MIWFQRPVTKVWRTKRYATGVCWITWGECNLEGRRTDQNERSNELFKERNERSKEHSKERNERSNERSNKRTKRVSK